MRHQTQLHGQNSTRTHQQAVSRPPSDALPSLLVGPIFASWCAPAHTKLGEAPARERSTSVLYVLS